MQTRTTTDTPTAPQLFQRFRISKMLTAGRASPWLSVSAQCLIFNSSARSLALAHLVRLDLSDNFHYIRSRCRSVPKKWGAHGYFLDSRMGLCSQGELSGGCISCVVATVRGHVKKLKKALSLTSASAVDLGCSLFKALLGSNERS